MLDPPRRPSTPDSPGRPPAPTPRTAAVTGHSTVRTHRPGHAHDVVAHQPMSPTRVIHRSSSPSASPCAHPGRCSTARGGRPSRARMKPPPPVLGEAADRPRLPYRGHRPARRHGLDGHRHAEMAGLNLLTYLTACLDACGRNGGKPPSDPDLERFLPWNAAPTDLHAWAQPPPARLTAAHHPVTASPPQPAGHAGCRHAQRTGLPSRYSGRSLYRPRPIRSGTLSRS